MSACSAQEDLRPILRDRVIEIWRLGGVDPADTQIFGYDPSIRPRSPACADLPEEDRWWASQASKLPSRKITQEALLASWQKALTAAGYAIRRYRSTASESRYMDAVHEKLGVYLEAFVTDDGNTTLVVTMGPCATRQVTNPDPPYIPEA